VQVFRLPLFDSQCSKTSEIVLVQPLIERVEMCLIRRIEEAGVHEHVPGSFDPLFERRSTPGGIADRVTMLKVTEEYVESEHHGNYEPGSNLPVTSRGDREYREHHGHGGRPEAEESTEHQHDDRVDRE
jgi:hypothetical protein